SWSTGQELPPPSGGAAQPQCRWRKVTASARVTGRSGWKLLVPPTPVVIPPRRAQATGAVKQVPAGTSEKRAVAALGRPAARQRKATISARVTARWGSNRSLPPTPVVIPFAWAQRTAAE